jgi:hypothetical protein
MTLYFRMHPGSGLLTTRGSVIWYAQLALDVLICVSRVNTLNRK